MLDYIHRDRGNTMVQMKLPVIFGQRWLELIGNSREREVYSRVGHCSRHRYHLARGVKPLPLGMGR